jgi:hypothetical protein
MRVLWQLNSTITCNIAWGTTSSCSLASAQTNEYEDNHQHSYTISNLTPGTKYYYRINVDQETYTGSFYSAPDASTKAIKFFAYGDPRSYPATHDQVAARIIGTYAGDESFQSFIISMGDLVSVGDNESDWDEQFFDPSYPNIQEMLTTLPYQSTMGNHDGSLFTKYFPYPFVAGRYWSFDYGPAHFVVVDQYTSYSTGSAQLEWIENDLASTNKIWKFIYLHKPGWSAGPHSNSTSVQNYIQPLCEQYNVSILFAGHNHNYARALVNNITHITTGGGGASLYQPDIGYPNIVYAEKAHHFCKIEIDNATLNFTAVTHEGNVIEAFTIDNPLPAELVSFTAIVNNNEVLLKWITETEVDNYGFDVERADLLNPPQGGRRSGWSKIGFVEGHGNSNSPKEYSFIDKYLLGGTIFQYRLKQLDNDGKFEYSGIVDVIIIPTEFALYQNYPNPFNPTTTIKYQIPKLSFVTITVYDVLGNEIETLVSEQKPIGNYDVEFNAKGLASGIYFYRLQVEDPSIGSESSFIETNKMVLMK